MTAPELADLADCSPSKIRQAIAEMQKRAISIGLRNDGHYDAGFMGESGHLVIKAHDRGDGFIAFGVTTDNHLCNTHSRLDVLNSLYDEFAREGVSVVFNCGNAIDGEM